MIPTLSNGILPRGKWMCTLNEFELTFVSNSTYTTPNSRKDLWDGLQVSLAALKALRCKVPEILISGSFITDKQSPDDIDVTFTVDGSTILNQDTVSKIKRVVEELKTQNKVDGHVIFWHPVKGTTEARSGDQEAYLKARGFWDDFWQRFVPKPDRIPFQRHHAFPRQGYVVVIIDDYN